ncbi:hypothetical protein PoB_000630800 [Plakobranchus ocellatus]|uniref:Uncharacterized protein n=1 Tax=Plakobranchus ocellatus TaxID=259542 RepID=A0AAV3YBD2_9GAST|nr:hypothetical protein PoB_000630800 [Plakobranchus ocellatus]
MRFVPDTSSEWRPSSEAKLVGRQARSRDVEPVCQRAFILFFFFSPPLSLFSPTTGDVFFLGLSLGSESDLAGVGCRPLGGFEVVTSCGQTVAVDPWC